MTPKQIFFYALEVGGVAAMVTAITNPPWWIGATLFVIGYGYRIVFVPWPRRRPKR